LPAGRPDSTAAGFPVVLGEEFLFRPGLSDDAAIRNGVLQPGHLTFLPAALCLSLSFAAHFGQVIVRPSLTESYSCKNNRAADDEASMIGGVGNRDSMLPGIPE
jgi:hypothetical protein